MRHLIALVSGFSIPLTGQMGFAQELPIFDDEDFEIVAFNSSSGVVAKSDGRYFYCFAGVNDAAGYVLVRGCIPFIGQSQTAVADMRAAEVAAAAAAAYADAVAAEAAAKAAADQAAKLEKERVLDQIASLDSFTAESAVVAVARKYGCGVGLDGGPISNAKLVQEMASESGIELEIYDSVGIQAATKRFGEAVNSLAEANLQIVDKGITMKLRDCN